MTAPFPTNAIRRVEVLQDLIALAKDLRSARRRGGESGLTAEHVAVHDALAGNRSAVDVLGNDQRWIIAHELQNGLKAKVGIDRAHRESARARLRGRAGRLLRSYGDPPDHEDAAVRGVPARAEALLARARA
jgi:type I restriction enzyme, R subunit